MVLVVPIARLTHTRCSLAHRREWIDKSGDNRAGGTCGSEAYTERNSLEAIEWTGGLTGVRSNRLSSTER